MTLNAKALLSGLLLATVTISAQSVVNPEIREEELRARATVVAEIRVENVDITEDQSTRRIVARAFVFAVISSNDRLEAGQEIEIRYVQDHARVAEEQAEQERAAEQGWAGPQVTGFPRLLDEGETVRAYLSADSSGGFYYPAADEMSFERIDAEQQTDPCRAIEDIGPIGSLVRECADLRYKAAEDELSTVVQSYLEILEPIANDDSTSERQFDVDVQRLWRFEESQRAWEMYRDAACEEVYFGYWPGSMAAAAQLDCLLELTEDRTAFLDQRLSE